MIIYFKINISGLIRIIMVAIYIKDTLKQHVASIIFDFKRQIRSN